MLLLPSVPRQSPGPRLVLFEVFGRTTAANERNEILFDRFPSFHVFFLLGALITVLYRSNGRTGYD